MSVTDLRAVLARVCRDQQEVSAHMVPVRYLAKLLHGQDVDQSTVQLAQLLLQVGELLSHMRDRVAGAVQGKSSLEPHNAVRHATCLLRVLALSEVQAALGADEQQVQQVVAAVQSAQQEFQCLCGSSRGAGTAHTRPGSNSTAAEVHAPAAVEAAAEGQEPGVSGEAGLGAPAAADEAAGAEESGQAAGAEAGGSLSVAQLPDLLEAAHGMAENTRSCLLTAISNLLRLAHGQYVDPAAVQLPQLLLQWPLLQQNMQQRFAGPLGRQKGLKPSTACKYAGCVLQLLSFGSMRVHLTSEQRQEVQQQISAAIAAWKALEGAPQPAGSPQPKPSSQALGGNSQAGSVDRGPESATVTPSSNATDQEYEPPGPAPGSIEAFLALAANKTVPAGAGAAAAAAHAPAGQQRPQRRSAAAAAARIQSAVEAERSQTVSQTVWVQHHDSWEIADRQKHGPPAAAKPKRRSDGTPGAAAAAATGEALPAAAAAHAHTQQQSDTPAQPSRLSLKQVARQVQQQNPNEFMSTNFTPLRTLAQLLGVREDSVQLAELLQQWDVLEEHLLQRVSGARKEGQAPLAVVSALGYVNKVLRLVTREPLVSAQLSQQELQDIQRKIAATKAQLGQCAGESSKEVDEQQQQQQQAEIEQQEQAETEQQQAAAPVASSGHAAAYTDAAAAAAAADTAPAPLTEAPAVDVKPSPAASVLQVPAQQTAAAQVSMPVTPAPAARAAAVLPTASATADTSLAAAVDAERNLLAAQRQLLALYADKLSPSLAEKLALRSTLQMLAELPPGDIRLDRFWADNDWLMMLSEEAESTPDHWREAFEALTRNANRDPGAATAASN